MKIIKIIKNLKIMKIRFLHIFNDFIYFLCLGDFLLLFPRDSGGAVMGGAQASETAPQSASYYYLRAAGVL